MKTMFIMTGLLLAITTPYNDEADMHSDLKGSLAWSNSQT